MKLSLKIAFCSLIASAYSTLSVLLAGSSYSWIQVRISEALTPLSFLVGFPAVAGLTIGCVITNLFSPVGLVDMVIGPLLTFCAAMLSWKLNFGKKIIACTYPVLVNAFGVSAYISSFYNVPYLMSVVTIAVGEFIAAVLVGYPLLVSIERAVGKFGKNEIEIPE